MTNNDQPTNRFRLYSNYTELYSGLSLKEAKALAVTESRKFDDIVRIEEDGNPRAMYFALYGVLYRATQTK